MILKELKCLISSYLYETDTIEEALKVMDRDKTPYLLVKKVNGELAGIITWEGILGILKCGSSSISVKEILEKKYLAACDNQAIQDLDFRQEKYIVICDRTDQPLGILYWNPNYSVTKPGLSQGQKEVAKKVL
ncbi:MAG: CBS domain-containing protein [Dehalobacterium sp.]